MSIRRADCFEEGAARVHIAAPIRSGGFTLVELLILLAVMGVVLVLSVPSFVAASDAMRLASISNSFVSHLQLARSEAMKRNGRVVLCRSAVHASCEAGANWQDGWIVFHDTNNNGILDPDEPLLGQSVALPRGYRLKGNGNVANYVSYSASGSAKLTTGAFQSGTFILCRPGFAGAEARHIVISNTGRPRIQSMMGGPCI